MRKKILLKGPLLTRSGYGEQSRFALRALRSRKDLFDIYIQPLQWGHTSWMAEINAERRWIDKAIEKTINYLQGGGTFDISLQVTIPNEWEEMAPINIGYTAGIETNLVSADWIMKGNNMDRIIVVSDHAKNVYKETGYNAQNNRTGEQMVLTLKKPIESVNYPVKVFDEMPELDLDLEYDFNFLVIAQNGPRKNLSNTLKWFVEEFYSDKVGLVVKTNMAKNCLMDREATYNVIQGLLADKPDRQCKIYLLHGDMTDEEIHSLYKHPKVSAFLTLTHGEGFGLPIFEAAYSELPVVAPGWSGQLDYLIDEKGRAYFYAVDFDIQPVPEEAYWENIIVKESMWCYPRELSAKFQMRSCYMENLFNTKEAVVKRAEQLHEDFSAEKLYAQFVEEVLGDEAQPEVAIEDVPKISLVTSVYGAEDYIEQLMEDVTRQTIFKEKCEWVILNANPEGHNTEEEVILNYIEKYPNNIVYKRLEKDPGIYDTWNMGIKMATGEFVTNVNCDDRRAPHGLEAQAKMLVANPDVDLVYNDSYITHEPNIMWEDIPQDCQKYDFEQFSKEAMLRGNLPHNNPMWRRTLHDNFGYFNQHYKSAGDWDMWLRCTFGGVKFKKHPEVLGVYYFNPTGMSTNPEHDSWKREHEKEIFQNYFQLYQQEQVGPAVNVK